MTQPNEDLVRAASAAFGRGDLGALQDQFFAADIVWHIAGTGPLAGDYEGAAQVMGLLGKIAELSGGTVRPGPHGRAHHDPRRTGGQAASAQPCPCHPRRKRQSGRGLDSFIRSRRGSAVLVIAHSRYIRGARQRSCTEEVIVRAGRRGAGRGRRGWAGCRPVCV